MPLHILGVGITEPTPALRAVHSGRIIARLIVGRHCLAQALQILALYFFLFYRHLALPFYVLVGSPEK